MREELPFDYEDGTYIPNSEVTLKSWFIENPITKDLVKSITIKMSPKCEKEFIIVMKAPNDRQQYSLASFLTLRLGDQERKRYKHFEKQLKSADSIEYIEIESKEVDKEEENEINVMLIGKLENPKLKCMRELRLSETDCNVIPLGVKISQAQ